MWDLFRSWVVGPRKSPKNLPWYYTSPPPAPPISLFLSSSKNIYSFRPNLYSRREIVLFNFPTFKFGAWVHSKNPPETPALSNIPLHCSEISAQTHRSGGEEILGACSVQQLSGLHGTDFSTRRKEFFSVHLHTVPLLTTPHLGTFTRFILHGQKTQVTTSMERNLNHCPKIPFAITI